MSETIDAPAGFRPMSDLTEQRHPVEMALRHGALVVGWLMVGVPTPQARTYWCQGPWDAATGRHAVVPVYPIGWRDLGRYGALSAARWR